MKEIWKDIKGYEGLYQISNLGNVKSMYNYRGIGNILKPRLKKGYYQIGLRKNNVRKWYAVHRLVAKTFIPNPDNLPQVNHKDENKLNNKVDNLEWCTVHYNNCYGSRLKKVAINNKLRKPIIQYDLNGNFIREYISISEASRQNNISTGNIQSCCKGKYAQAKGYIWRYKSEVMSNVNSI